MPWVEGWYFMKADRLLRHGDNRKVEAGVTHHVSCAPWLCKQGLHASVWAIDALQYAPGSHVARVALLDPVIGEDKMVAQTRQYLWVADATETLRAFARRCALSVIDKWNCPDVVKQHLETGDENLRAAATAAIVAPYACSTATRTQRNTQLEEMLNALHND